MLKTNKENLVKWSVQGKIHHPLGGNYRITFDGKPMVLPATGGISYNVKIGDSAFNWVGDHVEPGVSIRNENTTENAALTTFACIGNEAKTEDDYIEYTLEEILPLGFSGKNLD